MEEKIGTPDRRRYNGPERRNVRSRSRRNHKRLSRPFMVKMRIHSPDEEDKIIAHDIVFLRDLIRGGLLFNYNRGLREGTHIDFSINSAKVKTPITCRGEVIRIDRANKSPQCSIYHIAVRFIKADQDKYVTDSLNDLFQRYKTT